MQLLAWAACTEPFGVKLIRLGAGPVRVPPPGVSLWYEAWVSRQSLLPRAGGLGSGEERGGVGLRIGVGRGGRL